MEQPLKKKQTQYVDGEVFRGGGYKPTGKEMPERYYSECKIIVKNNHMVVEDYLKRFGNRLQPITMALSERRGKSANIITSIY